MGTIVDNFIDDDSDLSLKEIERKRQKQLKFDISYLKMAKIWAENSYAIRKKVGCLIVKNGMIISDGFNGTPSGFPNVCEDFKPPYLYNFQSSGCKEELDEVLKLYPDSKLETKKEVLHAESNALMKLAKSTNNSEGATLYVTCEPCFDCSKLIIQAGIKRVVYSDSYRMHDGIELLKRANIIVEQIKID